MMPYRTDQFSTTHETTQQQTTWTKGHSLEGQEALVVDSSYDFYKGISSRPAEHSPTFSVSSIASISNTTETETEVIEPQTNPTTQQQRTLQIPSFNNTSDWDTPTVDRPQSFHWPDVSRLVLKIILWILLTSWVYQVYSCVDLKQMPTERLYAVDPGAPINVWVPVFQWTCWKEGWFGKYPVSALWIIGTTISLYWLHWKRP